MEDREESALPAAQFNGELAEQVAGDARKLIVGRLSEAEFYQKHHKAYLKEFGVDNRPVRPVEGPGGAPSEAALARQVSRRTLLKLGGITAASILGARLLGGAGNKALAAEMAGGKSYGGLLLKENGEQSQPVGVQLGMVVDLEACDGCLSCVYACQNHNFNSAGVFWIYVLAFKDENRDGRNFLVRTCQHCANPPCVKV